MSKSYLLTLGETLKEISFAMLAMALKMVNSQYALSAMEQPATDLPEKPGCCLAFPPRRDPAIRRCCVGSGGRWCVNHRRC